MYSKKSEYSLPSFSLVLERCYVGKTRDKKAGDRLYELKGITKEDNRMYGIQKEGSP